MTIEQELKSESRKIFRRIDLKKLDYRGYMNKMSINRVFFRVLNRYIVVPAFKIGLGRLLSNPLTGRIMVLKTTGRKTGKMRYTPVSYALIDDNIYCYQGRQLKGQWYLNVLANPQVEVILPGRILMGYATEVKNAKEAGEAVRQILKNGGIGSFIYGFNPFTATDDVLSKKTEGLPVIRIEPLNGGM